MLRNKLVVPLLLLLVAIATCQPTKSPSDTRIAAQQPPQTLVAGDSIPIIYTFGGTPFATIVVTAPTVTPTNTPTVTRTPTVTPTFTPPPVPTTTPLYLPFIAIQSAPTVMAQMPLLTIQTVDAAGNPRNGVTIQIEICDADGPTPCVSYNSRTTLTSTLQRVDGMTINGIGYYSAPHGWWYRVIVSGQVIEFYWEPPEFDRRMTFTIP